jgi:dTMP kinase
VFVSVEGIEGSGKSTLVAGLAGRASKRFPRGVVVTREPGGTAVGDGVRSLFVDPPGPIEPLTEAFLVCASRVQLIAEVIGPALAEGKIVITDRFGDATLAYQGYGRRLDLAQVATLVALATNALEPDVTLLLDVPVTLSHDRVRERADKQHVQIDRLEEERMEFHERVRMGYRALALAAPTRIHMIDGSQSAEMVLDQAWALVDSQLKV